MPAWMSWGLLILALVFGIAGGILAAKVSMIMFWIGWIPGLACLAFFIYKSDGGEIVDDNTKIENLEEVESP